MVALKSAIYGNVNSYTHVVHKILVVLKATLVSNVNSLTVDGTLVALEGTISILCNWQES